MAEKPKPVKTPQAIEIPILFNLPVEMPTVYATNIIVQMTEFEVVLSFYEAQSPLDTESFKTLDIETLQKNGVRADCVARVTIAKGRFENIANVIHGMVRLGKSAEKGSK